MHLGGETGRIPGLNAMRFFGALSVIALHVGSRSYAQSHGWAYLHPLVDGDTGIVLFYVLSGFLITSLAIDEQRKTGRFHLALFLGRRALRLFPLYFLAIGAIFILHLLGATDVPRGSWPYALLYAYNFVPREDYNSLLGAFHTLATEEQYYLLYGALLFLLFSLGKNSGDPEHRWWAIFAGAFAIIVGNDFLLPLYAESNETHWVERWLVFAIDPILIGCMAAIGLRSGLVTRALRSTEEVGRAGTVSAILLLGFMGLYLSFVETRSVTMLSMGFAALLSHFFLFRTAKIHAVLQCRVLVYLGTISYGLYVWQAVFNGTGPTSRWIGDPWISTTLVFVVSVASFEWYEKRFLRLKRYAG